MRFIKRLIGLLVLLAILGGIAFWFVTAPQTVDASVIAGLPEGDAERGERIFWAGGCTSCHAAPKAEGDDRLRLGGGVELATEFGTFVAPNISQDATDGIGNWSAGDLVNAMMKGVSPDGRHYFPAFPYTSYARMKPADIADLHAFLKTLPAVPGAAPGHRLSFPFNIRRGVGAWKLLYMRDEPVVAVDETNEQLVLGRYLVEGPGHCGECHTPRLFSGGPKLDRWLSGARAAEGDGVVPNITPAEQGLGGWSAGDIANYLETGFTPDFDSVGGAMVEVQKNMALLPAADREAIAAYLKAIPGHPNGYTRN
ncbi:MAG: cytochrome c [Rhizobiaceae bacterium]|nr:cytochrome c [Rhizobiaceae bacterium]